MKNTGISVKVISAFLATLMLSTALVSCAKTTNDDGKTTSAAVVDTSSQTETESQYDSKGFLKDDLAADLNYGNKQVTVYRWTDVEHEEFTVESLSGEPVNDAIYNRNRAVEERLNVKLNFIGSAGNASNIASFTNKVETIINAGTHDFDIMACYSLTMAAIANRSLCLNLLEYDNLNFDKPWWPERLITEATINNKLYFCSGDISANMLYMMYVCYFNKKIVSDYGLENPQDLVRNNQWTLDKFIEMCSGVYSDLNGNNKKDSDDQFGYMSSGIHVDPFFYGDGCLILSKDSDDNLVVSDTWNSEKLIDVISKVNKLLWDTNDGMYTSSVLHQNNFAAGHLLFCTDRARIAITKLSVEGLDFGIVPQPKYNETQEDYITVVGNPFTLYALPKDCLDTDMCSAILECYASESYRQLTPALFEITLKLKYVSDDVSSQMYDIIRSSVTFDLGRIFSDVLIGQGAFRNIISGNSSGWATVAAAYAKAMPKKIESLMKAFNED